MAWTWKEAFFDYGNEPPGFIKCGEFLDWLSDLASEGKLCFNKLLCLVQNMYEDKTWMEVKNVEV
jgi:hypothetical protein